MKAMQGRSSTVAEVELDREIDFRAPNKDEYTVARVCGVSVQTVRRWRADKSGPRFRKIGAHVRYSLEDVFAWLDAQPCGGVASSATGHIAGTM